MRAIQIAEGHGWIRAGYETETFLALSRAVAWIFWSGSFNTDRFIPLFTLGPNVDLTDLEELGVGCTISRTAEPGRVAEYRPAEDAAVLGRVLSLLGAPIGAKNVTGSVALPGYLDDAPEPIRYEFVAVYLRNRGHHYEEKATIHFHEDRPREYLDTLAALIAAVSGERTTVSDKNVIISADAVRVLKG